MSIFIDDVIVITVDEKETVYQNGCIFIEDGLISYVGDIKDAPQLPSATKRIAGKGRIAMPGLINTHTHSPMALMRGTGDNAPLQQWLSEIVWPMEKKMDNNIMYWGNMLAIAEMIAGGTTTFNDMYFKMDEAGRAIEETGMRAMIVWSMDNLTDGSKPCVYEKELEKGIGIFERWHQQAEGRILSALSPHSEYLCHKNFLVAIRDAAKELGARIHIHVDETKKEHEECIERNGTTPFGFLESIGMLELPVMAAHCVHTPEKDFDILKRNSVNVMHNPNSNLKLGSGFAPIPQMLKAGINVSLATDGACSNDNLNMFEELQYASIMHKGYQQDATLIGAQAAIQMATANGAKTLGIENIGMLKKDYKADLILIDTAVAHMQPLNNPVAQIAYCAQASDVLLTMVDGRILYQDGQYLTLDIEKVLQQANNIAKTFID